MKTPKLYFLDTGLACFLAGIHTVEALRQSSLLGALFETLALGQIVRAYANQGRRPVLYFYRDHEGHEVDFVIPAGTLPRRPLRPGTRPHPGEDDPHPNTRASDDCAARRCDSRLR